MTAPITPIEALAIVLILAAILAVILSDWERDE